jgi:hypothetical protein
MKPVIETAEEKLQPSEYHRKQGRHFKSLAPRAGTPSF